MGRFKTKVITEESQVPEGFRRIAAIADSLADQKRLSDAHTDGLIRAVKLMRSTDDRTGPVWVCPEAAARVLAPVEPAGRPKPAYAAHGLDKGQAEAAVIALCEINNGITLMQATLERLTLAVESIATQPKTAHDRLVATAESNGFHN